MLVEIGRAEMDICGLAKEFGVITIEELREK